MMANLQSIDPERLGVEEGIREDMYIFLGGDVRVNFMGVLGAGGDSSQKVRRKVGRDMGWTEMWKEIEFRGIWVLTWEPGAIENPQNIWR